MCPSNWAQPLAGLLRKQRQKKRKNLFFNLDYKMSSSFFVCVRGYYFIYVDYVVFSSFRFSVFCFFFSPAARTNSTNVVNQKQSVLDAIAIGNSFLHKHQLVLLTLALVGLTLSNLHRFSGQLLTTKIVEKKQSNPAQVVEKKQSNPQNHYGNLPLIWQKYCFSIVCFDLYNFSQFSKLRHVCFGDRKKQCFQTPILMFLMSMKDFTR